MRVIAGKYKGRKLARWKQKLPVRPMTDQAKETIFNVLSPYLFEGCKVLDLFSGTGSLSVEAFSRGATEVHSVEKNSLCLQVIAKNTSFIEASKKFVLHRKNVFSFLKKYESTSPLHSSLVAFDLIFIDPPYQLRAGTQILESLSHSQLLHDNTVLMIHTSHTEQLKTAYATLKLFSLKKFRDKKIHFYKNELANEKP